MAGFLCTKGFELARGESSLVGGNSGGVGAIAGRPGSPLTALQVVGLAELLRVVYGARGNFLPVNPGLALRYFDGSFFGVVRQGVWLLPKG